MKCPRCGGESYVLDEEFVHMAEKISPPKLIIKSTFVCKSCSEKFTRVMAEDIGAKSGESEKSPSINEIMSELNFPSSKTHVDTSLLDSLGDIDPTKGKGSGPAERPRPVDI